jgi:HK97 family phage major capsid protein
VKNLETIKAKRSELLAKATAIVTAASTATRSLTDPEKTEYDQLVADVRGLDDSIQREETLQTLAMKQGAPVEDARAQGPDRKKESRAAFFKYVRRGKDALNHEERALVEDTAGLYMVPEDLAAEIYRELPQLNFIRQMANIRQTTRDRVAKRSVTEVSMSWGKLETGAQIAESTPNPLKDWIYVEDLNGLSKIGKDELMDSDDILAGILADSFAQARANAEAAAFVVGRGHTYGEPDGVTLDPTIIANYIDLDTADTITPDDVIDIEYALPAQYKQSGGASFLWNPSTEAMLRKVKATANYLWTNPIGITGAAPKTFDGYPVYNSDAMIVPASTNTDRAIVALYGNWKAGYTIVDRMGMSIQRLDELYAESGMVGFLAHFRVGGGVVRGNAFRALDNNT